MVNALLSLAVIIGGCFLIWTLLKFVLRPFRRLYYEGKAFFRGKYFHKHHFEDDRLVIVYRTDFDTWFWTLMGKIYSFAVFIIPLFFLMVRLDGSNGYALAQNRYSAGDEVMYYDITEHSSDTGIYVSNSDGLVIKNDAGEEVAITGFVIGKYYQEPLTIMSAPGLFVRSTAANVKTATHFVLKTFF